MLRIALLLAAFTALAACEAEPTLSYQYVVRGDARSARVRYFAGTGGLTQETVALPWTSAEFQGTERTPVRIDATAARGARLECSVRYRAPDGEYGGNASGELTNVPDPGAGRTACKLDQTLDVPEG